MKPEQNKEAFIPKPSNYKKYIGVVQHDREFNFDTRLKALYAEQSRIDRILLENYESGFVISTEYGYYQRLKSYSSWLDDEIDTEELWLILNSPSPSVEIHEDETVDSEILSASAKVIYIIELGIVDFLRSKHPVLCTSVNKLAYSLSKITGEKQGTIQSYLNRILNEKNVDGKNPYINTKVVTAIREALLMNGIQPHSSQ